MVTGNTVSNIQVLRFIHVISIYANKTYRTNPMADFSISFVPNLPFVREEACQITESVFA